MTDLLDNDLGTKVESSQTNTAQDRATHKPDAEMIGWSKNTQKTGVFFAQFFLFWLTWYTSRVWWVGSIHIYTQISTRRLAGSKCTSLPRAAVAFLPRPRVESSTPDRGAPNPGACLCCVMLFVFLQPATPSTHLRLLLLRRRIMRRLRHQLLTLIAL